MIPSLAEEKIVHTTYQDELVKVTKETGIGGSTIVLNVLLSYINTVLATRVVGAEAFGVFFLANQIVFTALHVSTLGLGQGVMRHVSLYDGQRDYARVKGAMVFCLKRALLASIVVSLVIFALSPLFADKIFDKPELRMALRVLVVAVPFWAIMEIVATSLQGLRRIAPATLLRNFLQPFSRLLLLTILFLLGYKLAGLLWGTALSMVASAGFAIYLLRKNTKSFWEKVQPIFENREIQKFSMPLYFDTILNFVIASLPLYILGYYWTYIEVGVYGVALRLALLVGLPLAALNQVFAPTISNLYGRGDKQALSLLFKTVTKWVFTASLAVSLVMVLFARPLLSIFGSNFVVGAGPLAVIVMGELVNASVGSVGYMLSMTGRPLVNLINSIVSAVLMTGLGLILIPKHGLLGAALTACLSVSIVNIVRMVEVYYFEKIHPYNDKYIKPLIAAATAIAGVFGLRLLLPGDNLLATVLGILTFGLIFVGSFLWLRIEDEDRLILRLVSRKLNFFRMGTASEF